MDIITELLVPDYYLALEKIASAVHGGERKNLMPSYGSCRFTQEEVDRMHSQVLYKATFEGTRPLGRLDPGTGPCMWHYKGSGGGRNCGALP